MLISSLVRTFQCLLLADLFVDPFGCAFLDEGLHALFEIFGHSEIYDNLAGICDAICHAVDVGEMRSSPVWWL